MKGDLMVLWLEECVVPAMPAGESVLIVMDGFTGHASLPFLRALRARNYHLVFRYPHSSHKTQVRAGVLLRFDLLMCVVKIRR